MLETLMKNRKLRPFAYDKKLLFCFFTDGLQFKPNYDNKRIFNNMEENDLGNYPKTAAKHNHGLSPAETRKLAYQYAVKNNKKVPESWKKREEAGPDWLSLFMRRNSISIQVLKQQA